MGQDIVELKNEFEPYIVIDNEDSENRQTNNRSVLYVMNEPPIEGIIEADSTDMIVDNVSKFIL